MLIDLVCFIFGVFISIIISLLFNYLWIAGLLAGILAYFLGGFIIGKKLSMRGWKKKSLLFGIGPICSGLISHFISNSAIVKGDIELWLFFTFTLINTIYIPLSYMGARLGSGNVISYNKFKEKISRAMPFDKRRGLRSHIT